MHSHTESKEVISQTSEQIYEKAKMGLAAAFQEGYVYPAIYKIAADLIITSLKAGFSFEIFVKESLFDYMRYYLNFSNDDVTLQNQAVDILTKAVALNYPEAQFIWGRIITQGYDPTEVSKEVWKWKHVTPEAREQGFSWYFKAAQQGYPAAQFRVAEAYINKWGVEQDHALGIAWYVKSARQGFTPSIHALGYHYAWMDENPNTNPAATLTIEWTKISAEKGACAAIRYLAEHYAKGAKDVPQNKIKSMQMHLLEAAKVLKNDDLRSFEIHYIKKFPVTINTESYTNFCAFFYAGVIRIIIDDNIKNLHKSRRPVKSEEKTSEKFKESETGMGDGRRMFASSQQIPAHSSLPRIIEKLKHEFMSMHNTHKDLFYSLLSRLPASTGSIFLETFFPKEKKQILVELNLLKENHIAAIEDKSTLPLGLTKEVIDNRSILPVLYVECFAKSVTTLEENLFDLMQGRASSFDVDSCTILLKKLEPHKNILDLPLCSDETYLEKLKILYTMLINEKSALSLAHSPRFYKTPSLFFKILDGAIRQINDVLPKRCMEQTFDLVTPAELREMPENHVASLRIHF